MCRCKIPNKQKESITVIKYQNADILKYIKFT